VYASIAIAAGLILAIQLAFSPPGVVSFTIAAAAALAVVTYNRSALRAAETFPELRRFRAIRLIVGD
jgi:hypothetical protein